MGMVIRTERTPVVIAVLVAVLGGATGPVSAASPSGQCGTVVQSAPPPSLQPGSFEADGAIRLVAESHSRQLGAPLAVDVAAPGAYDREVGLSAVRPAIAAGTVVDSVLLQADPPGQPKPGETFVASLTFARDILGVAVLDTALDAGDAVVGVAGTIYPTGVNNRGLELSPTGDRVSLLGRRTIELVVLTTSITDEIRIVPAAADATAASPAGYRLLASDGGVFAFGGRLFQGASTASAGSPFVAAASTCTGDGYWTVAADGSAFPFGDAPTESPGRSVHLNQPIVGIAGTLSSRVYWIAAADGGIFTLGDAHFFGSMASKPLKNPIVGIAATPTGEGYWLVASDGGVFTFGDAGFFGSTGSVRLNKPVVGMTSTPTGRGNWLVASDGGIFAFGDAAFHGSTGGIALNKPIVGLFVTPTSQGYSLVASDGGIFAFGDAAFYGSLGDVRLNRPIVAAM